MNFIPFGYVEELFMNMWFAKAKDLQSEFFMVGYIGGNWCNNGEMMEIDGRNIGGNSSHVFISLACNIG
jgi:hypothetical protein